LGLTQRDVSRYLNSESDNNILGAIESSYRSERYTDSQLNILVKEFSHLNSTRSYTIADFYPKEPINEELVPKILIELPERKGVTTALRKLLEENRDFAINWITTREIVEICNQTFNRKWISKDFTSAINNLIKAGWLERKSESEALFKRP